jgi:GMP synthase (glutamine-hydrolysing)
MLRGAARLVKDGYALTVADAEGFAADLRTLYETPHRKDLSWRYAIGPDIVDPLHHRREFANWLRVMVAPRASATAAMAVPA